MGRQIDSSGNYLDSPLDTSQVQVKNQIGPDGQYLNKPQQSVTQTAPTPQSQSSSAPPSSFIDRLKLAMSASAVRGLAESRVFDPKEITSMLPMLGAMAAPETGGLSLLGAGAGSLLKQGINEKIDKTNPSWGQSAQDTAGDVIGQAILPKAIGMAFNPRLTVAKSLANPIVQKIFPQIKNTTAGVQAKALQFPETGILESAAHNTDALATDFIDKFNKAPDAKAQNAIWNDYQNQVGTNNVATSLLRLNRDVESGGSVANQQKYKSITNTILSDVSQVRNLKMLPGGAGAAQQLAQNDVLTGAFKSKGEFDPDSLLSKLTGTKSEIYQEAMGKSYDNLKKLAETAPSATQGNMISYVKHRLVWTGALMAGGEELGLHHVVSAAVAGGYILSDKAVSMAMQDPIVSQLVLKAMKTPLNAPEAGLIQKVLTTALRGAEAYSQMPSSDSIDGKPTIHKVTIEPGGPQLAK